MEIEQSRQSFLRVFVLQIAEAKNIFRVLESISNSPVLVHIFCMRFSGKCAIVKSIILRTTVPKSKLNGR